MFSTCRASYQSNEDSEDSKRIREKVVTDFIHGKTMTTVGTMRTPKRVRDKVGDGFNPSRVISTVTTEKTCLNILRLFFESSLSSIAN